MIDPNTRVLYISANDKAGPFDGSNGMIDFGIPLSTTKGPLQVLYGNTTLVPKRSRTLHPHPTFLELNAMDLEGLLLITRNLAHSW